MQHSAHVFRKCEYGRRSRTICEDVLTHKDISERIISFLIMAKRTDIFIVKQKSLFQEAFTLLDISPIALNNFISSISREKLDAEKLI